MRFPISSKLISLIALLLVGSIATLIWFATRLFIADNTALIQQMNSDTAMGLAVQVREVFSGLTENMRILGIELLESSSPLDQKKSEHDYFEGNPNLVGVLLQSHEGEEKSKVVGSLLAKEITALGADQQLSIEAELLKDPFFSIQQLYRGEIQLGTFSLSDGNLIVALGIPFVKQTNGTDFSHSLIGLIAYRKFLKTFGDSNLQLSYLLDREGRLVAHRDLELVTSKQKMVHLEIVRQFLTGKFNNGLTRYQDPQSRETRLGAFRAVGFAGLGVITEVPEAKAFEAARRVEYRALLIALLVLSVSFLFGYIFSSSITSPIKALVGAAHQIALGDFKINLKPKSKDEIADLSIAFNEMARGLDERDRIKETFNKFHNKEIAEKILTGSVKLGGERRLATILFTDIRSFTAMSEQMDPAHVVDLLNEYLTRMVAIIRKYGGVVDKYVGDAIMAVWGVPLEKQDDTYKAVAACLAMRLQLSKLNESRIARKEIPLMIGMGLNRGEVIAGNIGSVEKMEYTVIGDTVNVASRIESMTKRFGTDLLVSETVVTAVLNQFWFEKCGNVMVKGKSSAIGMYRVPGFVDREGRRTSVRTSYSDYEAESEKGKSPEQKKAA